MAMSGAKKIIHQNTRLRKGNNRETTSGTPLGLTWGRLPESVPVSAFSNILDFLLPARMSHSGICNLAVTNGS